VLRLGGHGDVLSMLSVITMDSAVLFHECTVTGCSWTASSKLLFARFSSVPGWCCGRPAWACSVGISYIYGYGTFFTHWHISQYGVMAGRIPGLLRQTEDGLVLPTSHQCAIIQRHVQDNPGPTFKQHLTPCPVSGITKRVLTAVFTPLSREAVSPLIPA
jgi:hypothetical protein